VITVVVLTTAAFLGGALNALAGGGTFVTFPALLFAGLNPIEANASSVVCLVFLEHFPVLGRTAATSLL